MAGVFCIEDTLRRKKFIEFVTQQLESQYDHNCFPVQTVVGANAAS